jgi:hypothetical protein
MYVCSIEDNHYAFNVTLYIHIVYIQPMYIYLRENKVTINKTITSYGTLPVNLPTYYHHRNPRSYLRRSMFEKKDIFFS